MAQFQIIHNAFDGAKKVVFEGAELENAVGYMCAIVAPDVKRRNVRHFMTHPSFRTKSFTASAPDGGMYRLELKW